MPAADATVNVWIVRADEPDPRHSPEALSGALSPHERARADAYRDEVVRRRFIVARAAFREILGGYLGLQPSEIVFRRTRAGMPVVAGTTLRVSTSRRNGLALLAVSGRPVGVDLEYVRAGLWTPAFAESCFGTRSCTADTQELFRLWTRREAVAKLRGTGIPAPEPPTDAVVFEDLPVPGEYVATLTVFEPAARVAVHDWPPRPPASRRT